MLFEHCKKEVASSVAVVQTPLTIKLIYPINGIEVDPCCTTFSFETADTGISHLTLGTDSTFINFTLDTLIYAKEFTFRQNLIPAKMYYWRIKQNGLQSRSSFKVKDVLKKFEVSVIVNVVESQTCTPGPTSVFDYYKTRLDTFLFKRDGINIRVYHQTDTMGSLFLFSPPWPIEYVNYHGINQTSGKITYGSDYFYQGSCSNLTFNYITDSVFYSSPSGGLGCRQYFSYSGKIK